MRVEIVMPKMGESIQEGTILRWAKTVGEKIAKDETLLEISTDKVDSEIPSPVSGILAKIFAREHATVSVGTAIAIIETDNAVSISEPALSEEENGSTNQSDVPISIQHKTISKSERQRFYSPLVRSIAKRENISEEELNRVLGSGINRRVTKNDLLAYLQQRAALLGTLREFTLKKSNREELLKKYPAPWYEVTKMTNVQQKMAEHMLRSVATSPHVTVVDEADVTEIVRYRQRTAKEFEANYATKMTFTPFFASAVVKAVKDFPIVNSSLEGDTIIFKKFIHLGIAVASPAGLLVPTIKNAESKTIVELARSINDIAERARLKKILPDELFDGTFSITNYGVFGNMIGTPIINQPQVAILGTGAIKKRPVVVTDANGNDEVAIRSMVYVTLSFDHRVIDGETGGKFLAAVRRYLEHFDFERY
ncbi:MAG TPA: dihydrolipoamide acetyltransferase family protein [Bacteroidota bacterium]|nr:dihydrolipoamide acetyltransferase family protein [Bacteroidota bacterium]